MGQSASRVLDNWALVMTTLVVFECAFHRRESRGRARRGYTCSLGSQQTLCRMSIEVVVEGLSRMGKKV